MNREKAAARVFGLLDELHAVMNRHLDEHKDAEGLVNDLRWASLKLAADTAANTHWHTAEASLRFAQMLVLPEKEHRDV